jgi:hypothetical protein
MLVTIKSKTFAFQNIKINYLPCYSYWYEDWTLTFRGDYMYKVEILGKKVIRKIRDILHYN